ncbi:hypothetical protein (DUF388) [Alteracholeplasma palmae J233]|uniref:InlB B-repeat-containing protein n=1 Tax=Alteracholeplasma palmae (strain ATCC 49389 / J233) TaxID=1318466 RepID=U4KJM8_ALTPJ|nr:InlB B-repeat-containing protein [Alteracholeplasma palmae]CCV63598.1 hypothetical protein (DUF388) [Alteracholeplasma palmae J233]
MQRIKKALAVLFIFSLSLVLIACNDTNKEKSEETYTVSFEGTDVENQSVQKDQIVNEPTNVTKEGYTFIGWYEDETYTTVFDFTKKITQDTKIYALFYTSIKTILDLGSKLEHGSVSTDIYFVKGTIKSIANSTYGNMTITDGDQSIFVYGVFGDNDIKFSELTNIPVVGDIIYIKGPIKKFNDDVELNNTKYIKHEKNDTTEKVTVTFAETSLKPMTISKGQTIEEPQQPNKEGFIFAGWYSDKEYTKAYDFKSAIDADITIYAKYIDLTQYAEMDLLSARSQTIGTNVIIKGVVAQITYADKHKPNGVFIVDDTNAMYIFDDKIASEVEIGNYIKVAGTRKNFILEKEQPAAQKHQYEGAIQVADTYLMELTKGNQNFNKDWIPETTIKELHDTKPYDKNITGTIYKVNAFIRKVEGKGFDNYYFNDLDDKTGFYAYTANSGSDFKWLDEYDGQLRTVYLSVINAKSSPSDIIYRVIPMSIEEVYSYNTDYNPEFAVKYRAKEQFTNNYLEGYSPEVDLITTVEFETLGIKNTNLTYTSSNTEALEFITENNKLTFKVKNKGIITVTITGTYEDKEYQEEIQIEVFSTPNVDIKTIEDILKLEDETEVYVEGNIIASLVNKTGFYIVDQTGIIAVQLVQDEFNKIALGNKVIIKGKKTHDGVKYGKDNQLSSVGQLVIDDAVIIANKYGNHQYESDILIKNKTLSDFINLKATEEHTDKVYLLEAKIEYKETPFSSNYLLTEGKNSLNIYSANGGQLSFLEPYKDQTVQVEFAVVNWNGKTAGAVLAVIIDGQRIPNPSNF